MKRRRRPPPIIWANEKYAVAVPCKLTYTNGGTHQVNWGEVAWTRQDAVSLAVIHHGHLVGISFPRQTNPEILRTIHRALRDKAWGALYRRGYRIVKVRLDVIE